MSSQFPINSVEWRLEQRYVAELMKSGISKQEASEAFDRFVEESKKDSTPDGCGDLLLTSTDPKVTSTLDRIRSEGIDDEDIRAWHNMHRIERRCISGISELQRMAMFIDGLRGGQKPDDVTINIFKYFPRYEDINCTEWGGKVRHRLTEDDRPFPHEAHFKVERFIEKHKNDPQFRNRMRQATSLNALIRQDERDGGAVKHVNPPEGVATPTRVQEVDYLNANVLTSEQEQCLSAIATKMLDGEMVQAKDLMINCQNRFQYAKTYKVYLADLKKTTAEIRQAAAKGDYRFLDMCGVPDHMKSPAMLDAVLEAWSDAVNEKCRQVGAYFLSKWGEPITNYTEGAKGCTSVLLAACGIITLVAFLMSYVK